MDKIVDIKDLELPPVIYKYRDYYNENHISALLNKEIFIPSVKTFNDPYDSRIPFRYRDEDLTEDNIYKKCLQIAQYFYPDYTKEEHQQLAYENQKKGLLNDEEHLEIFDKENYEQTCNEFGIYCVTEDSQNLLMWSYYSNSHTGFCIGYSSKKIVDSGIFGMGGKVNYTNEFPKLPLFPSEEDHPFLDLFYTKWEVWKHENEFRLLHKYKYGQKYDIPDDYIVEIILGCKFAEKEKLPFVEKIIKVFGKVKIYEIELDMKTFGLKKKIVFDGNVPLLNNPK